MLNLSPAAHAAANSAILISGSARSGTTIVGKLVHSFAKLEYMFEPPTLIGLFSAIDQIPEQQWKFLYETFLYEEFLINAISGRAINTNRADDSSIYAAKTETDIAYRQQRSWSKADASALASDCRVAYKIPNIVPFIPKLQARYPDTAIVMVLRGALETIHSLLAKKTFTDAFQNSPLAWPYRMHKGQRVPYWVKESDDPLWGDLREIDRYAYYYIRMHDEQQSAGLQFNLKYELLLDNPRATAEALAEWLGVSFGPRTDDIIATIKPTRKVLDRDLLNQISPEFRSEIARISRDFG